MLKGYLSGKEWHFKRVCIVTGVGRSGTSILAKLIGSMENTLLLYEPAITKFALHHPSMDQLTRNILMEDYFIPLIIGRSRNVNEGEESWQGNYWSHRLYLRSRAEAVRYIEKRNPLFVIKTLETQPLIPRMRELFPGCKIIDAVRHGNSVIGSSLARGWYTDAWLNGSIIDYAVGHTNCKIPWYMPEGIRDYFAKADPVTRIALNWAILSRHGCRHFIMHLPHEDVLSMPDKTINLIANYLQARPTALTDTHRAAIQRHPESRYHDFTEQIAKGARSYYQKTLNMLDYG